VAALLDECAGLEEPGQGGEAAEPGSSRASGSDSGADAATSWQGSSPGGGPGSGGGGGGGGASLAALAALAGQAPGDRAAQLRVLAHLGPMLQAVLARDADHRWAKPAPAKSGPLPSARGGGWFRRPANTVLPAPAPCPRGQPPRGPGAHPPAQVCGGSGALRGGAPAAHRGAVRPGVRAGGRPRVLRRAGAVVAGGAGGRRHRHRPRWCCRRRWGRGAAAQAQAALMLSSQVGPGGGGTGTGRAGAVVAGGAGGRRHRRAAPVLASAPRAACWSAVPRRARGRGCACAAGQVWRAGHRLRAAGGPDWGEQRRAVALRGGGGAAAWLLGAAQVGTGRAAGHGARRRRRRPAWRQSC
jgi:hypothetical protein